jgi:hypothetical protein
MAQIIDSNIPLSGNQFQPIDPARIIGQWMQLGMLRDEQEARRLELDLRRADQARQGRVTQILSQAGGNVTPETIQAVSQEDPELGFKLQGLYTKQIGDQFDLAQKRAEAVARVAAGSQDQATWDAGRTELAELGIQLPDAYRTFSPGLMKSLVFKAGSIKDMIAAQRPEPVKTRQVTVRLPDGTEETRIVEDVPGQTFTSAAAPTKRTFQAKDVLVNGRPMLANFDTQSGEYFDPSSGQKLTGVRPIPPAQQRDDRIVQIMGPNGVPIWVTESEAVGKPAAQAPRAVTGAERGALAYYNRARDANETITQTGSTPNGLRQPSLEERMANQSLLGQAQLQYGWNITQTSEQQAYRQAQRAFTEARLRKESGAAIPNEEYANDARTYFAQPGDSKETIEQKRKARDKVLEGLAYSAGKAYDEFYGETFRTPSAAKPITTPQTAGAITPKVGDIVTFNGRKYRVKAINKGTADLEPIDPQQVKK